MFIDRARIKVSGGDGGNGCVAFRRETYVPRGGPSGGDGGDGGSVYLVATSRTNSLAEVRYHWHRIAKRGEHGMGKDCHGRNGEDALVYVPQGTLVRAVNTNEVLADLLQEGQRFLAAKGGRGGRGNARFTTSTNRAPKFAERGEPGENFEYVLELKLIAEVGIVGLPNAGKSTLLAAISAARPKIANYQFTTLSPNLGVVSLSDHRTMTVADIPGIIEGAAEGKGLGHDFLRHIERTKVLLFLIDLGDPDPAATYRTLEEELLQHSVMFEDRPRVLALNKADITESRARFEEVAADFDNPFLISGATGEGVPALLEHLWGLVEQIRLTPDDTVVVMPEREYTYEPPYTIEPIPQGFRIAGYKVVQAARMVDFDNEEAARYFHGRLKKMGVFKALERLGAHEGQIILIGDTELEYHPD